MGGRLGLPFGCGEACREVSFSAPEEVPGGVFNFLLSLSFSSRTVPAGRACRHFLQVWPAGTLRLGSLPLAPSSGEGGELGRKKSEGDSAGATLGSSRVRKKATGAAAAAATDRPVSEEGPRAGRAAGGGSPVPSAGHGPLLMKSLSLPVVWD